MFRSDDDGATRIDGGLPANITGFAFQGSTLFAGTAGNGVWRYLGN